MSSIISILRDQTKIKQLTIFMQISIIFRQLKKLPRKRKSLVRYGGADDKENDLQSKPFKIVHNVNCQSDHSWS